MKYYIYSSLLNALTSAVCCIFVLLSKKKTKTSKAFFLFTLSVTFWSGFYFNWLMCTDEKIALLFVRLLNLSALFIPPTFLHFCCHLLQRYEKFKKIIKFFYILNFLLSPFTLAPLYINHVESVSIFKYWPKPGPLYLIFLFEYFVLIGIALIELFKKLKHAKDIKEKRMFQFVSYGLVVGFLGGSTNLFYFYNIPIPPVGNIVVPLYTFGVMYAIFKYQFMDIAIVLKRSLVYTLLITIITLFCLLAIYFTEHILQSFIGYRSIFISMAYATIIALAFIPLKNLIQNFVEKILFRGSYVQIVEENELLRQEVMQTEKLKSIAILASGMAHEIKNPLTLLKTFSEFLPSKVDDKAFLKKFSPMVAHEINRIDELVHNLLDFAKPTPPALKPTDIHQLLNQTLDLLSNDLIKHHIQCVRQYHPDGRCLDLDPQQISQAILNIVLNAIEAMPSGGTLTVSTSVVILSPKGEESKGTLRSFVPTKSVGTQDDRITIKIQDTGYGISPEHLPHIFDPFFTQKDHGTGLGLSITHEIIRHHQGRIFVESQVGKGTTFIIDLPLS